MASFTIKSHAKFNNVREVDEETGVSSVKDIKDTRRFILGDMPLMTSQGY